MNIDPFRDSPLAQLSNEVILLVLSKLSDKSLIIFAKSAKTTEQIEQAIAQKSADRIFSVAKSIAKKDDTELFHDNAIGDVEAIVNYELKKRILKHTQNYDLSEEEVFREIEFNRINLIIYLSVMIGSNDLYKRLRDHEDSAVFLDNVKYLTGLSDDIFTIEFNNAALIISNKNIILMQQLLLLGPPLTIQNKCTIIQGIMRSKKVHNQSMSLLFYISDINCDFDNSVIKDYIFSLFKLYRINYNDRAHFFFIHFIRILMLRFENKFTKEYIFKLAHMQVNFINLLIFCSNSFYDLKRIPSLLELLTGDNLDMRVINAIGYDNLCQLTVLPDHAIVLINVFKNYSFINFNKFLNSKTKSQDLLALYELLISKAFIHVATKFVKLKSSSMDVCKRYLDPLFIEMMTVCKTNITILERMSCARCLNESINYVFDLYKQDKNIIDKLLTYVLLFQKSFLPKKEYSSDLEFKFEKYIFNLFDNLPLYKIVNNIKYFDIFHHPFMKQLFIIKICEEAGKNSIDLPIPIELSRYQLIANFFNEIGEKNVNKLLSPDFTRVLGSCSHLLSDDRNSDRIFNQLIYRIWFTVNMINRTDFLENFSPMPDVSIITRLIDRFGCKLLIELASIKSQQQQMPNLSLLKALMHPKLIDYIDRCTYKAIHYSSSEIFLKYHKYTSSKGEPANDSTEQAKESIAAKLSFFSSNTQLSVPIIREINNSTAHTTHENNKLGTTCAEGLVDTSNFNGDECKSQSNIDETNDRSRITFSAFIKKRQS